MDEKRGGRRRSGSGRGDGAWEEGAGMELGGAKGVDRRETWEMKSTEEDFDRMWGIRERAMLKIAPRFLACLTE